MNRPGKQQLPTELSQLMPEHCFMDLQTFNSPMVTDHIEDKEAHSKTMNSMLKNAIKERIKEKSHRK
jgi:hypothetical protein